MDRADGPAGNRVRRVLTVPTVGSYPLVVTSALGNLTRQQQTLLARWLPGTSVEAEHSWGLVATTVLEVTCAGARFIVKAGGDDDHGIRRELDAHANWLRPWTDRGRAPALVHGDVDAKLLVTRYLPGQLVLGSEHADDPRLYRQAGELLALLHAQFVVTDDDHERRENEKALAWLRRPHRIAAHTVRRLRAEITSWPTPSASLVPTHGDWQPRNWLVHEGVLSVIDFGRAPCVPRTRTSVGWPPGTSGAIRGSRQPSSTVMGPIPVSRTRGTGTGSARRSAPRPGRTGWATRRSRRRAIA